MNDATETPRVMEVYILHSVGVVSDLPGVLHVGVLLEALLAEHDGGSGPTADREGVPHHAPLGLTVEGHDLAQVVDEAHQVVPVLVRVLLPDPLGSLESVHDVGQVQVGVTLVHQVIQHRLNSKDSITPSSLI